jgi:hypothetical protein
MTVKPPAPKHISEDLGDKLIISIPSLKHWFFIIYLGFFVLSVIAAEFVILGTLIFNRNAFDGPILVLAAGAIFWTLATGLFIYQFAWQVSGKEVIEVSAKSITTSRVALGIRSPKEYLADHIKELRVSSSNMNLNHPMLWWTYSYYNPWSHNMVGSLAFDYGAQTFRFGMSIDEAEAKQIVAEIQQKFPQYKN